MQTDVGDDLFSAWWEVTGSEYAKPDGTFDPRYMERNFKQLVKNLGVLEAAASYGADHVGPRKRGKPAVLTRDDIWNLAAVYRDSDRLDTRSVGRTIRQICYEIFDRARPPR